LLDDLSDRAVLIRTNARSYSSQSDDVLLARPSQGQWCIAEIFEHLNLSNSIYIRSIISAIERARETAVDDNYKTGWLGDLLYNKTLPRQDGSVFKMKAPRFLQPTGSTDITQIFADYFEQLDVLDKILQKARMVNLQKIKIPLSFAAIVKLRLGDNLRYLIAHHERHLLQASKTLGKVAAISQ